MEIRTIGVGGRLKTCESILGSCPRESRYKRLLLLPIPTTRDKKYITGTDTSLEDAAALVVEGTLVAGYNIPDSFGAQLCEAGAEVYDAALDEEFLSENAEITAHGALGRILCDFPKDASELKVGIVGYGRIGSRLLRLLLFLGAKVKVYTGKENIRLELCGAGLDCELLSEKSDFSELELIINTAPARIMSEEDVERLAPSTKIMDLASGNNFPDSPCVIKLASVPDAMYPVTAGGIYAKYIARYLYDEREE